MQIIKPKTISQNQTLSLSLSPSLYLYDIYMGR